MNLQTPVFYAHEYDAKVACIAFDTPFQPRKPLKTPRICRKTTNLSKFVYRFYVLLWQNPLKTQA